MRLRSLLRIALPVFCLAALPAMASVVVSFPGSERYTDIGPKGIAAEEKLAELQRHLQHLGDRYLSPQQTLRIDVLDIQLGGTRNVGRDDIRVQRGRADWPVIRVRYTLETPGRAPQSGEETLSDTTFVFVPDKTKETQALYYEKRMLEGWFKERFAQVSTLR